MPPTLPPSRSSSSCAHSHPLSCGLRFMPRKIQNQSLEFPTPRSETSRSRENRCKLWGPAMNQGMISPFGLILAKAWELDRGCWQLISWLLMDGGGWRDWRGRGAGRRVNDRSRGREGRHGLSLCNPFAQHAATVSNFPITTLGSCGGGWGRML